jgi:hypothetical protein
LTCEMGGSAMVCHVKRRSSGGWWRNPAPVENGGLSNCL